MKIEIRNIDNEIIISGEYQDIRHAVEKNKHNLSDANLRYAKLSGADLRYANLRNADLSYANLSGADLSYANLRGANLRGANLRGADLSSANLRYANLNYANLIGVYLSGADLSGADLRSAKGINKNVVCQLNYLYDQVGKIRLYKLVNDKYESPMYCSKLTYKIGEIISVDNADTDDTELCSAGINVATLDWCMREWQSGRHILIVEFEASDIACIPIATDGKIRLHRCKVVGEKDLVELGLITSEEASDE